MDDELDWPRPFKVRPRVVMIAASSLVALAWVLFLVIDIGGWLSLPNGRVAWRELFNDRPVEWAQWLLQGAAILTAGFTAGRIAREEHRGLRTFLLLLGAGLVLMLFEDAGDARHVISNYVAAVFGTEVLGLPHRVVSDVPYFLVIAALPVYAIVRYGRDAWSAPTARPYLISGYGLYALTAGGSGIRYLGDLYTSFGAGIDRLLFAGRFPVPSGSQQDVAHFMLVDSVLEESLETLAAASLMAAILAVGHDLREGRLEPRRLAPVR